MSAIVQISKSCWAGISFVKRGPALDMCIPMTRAVVRRSSYTKLVLSRVTTRRYGALQTQIVVRRRLANL